jgi:hypothetical protein
MHGTRVRGKGKVGPHSRRSVNPQCYKWTFGEEIKRMVAPGGVALLCEQTDPEDNYVDLFSENKLLTHGREISTYEAWMKPMTLIQSSERIIEPTHRLKKVGSFMLFQKPS